MTLFVAPAQSVLDRFEAKRQAVGLEFTPPDKDADLGRYAFPADVFEQISMGLATGLLTEGIVYLLHLSYVEWEKRRTKAAKNSAEGRTDFLVREIQASTKIAEEAIQKLQDQGVKSDQAKAAIDLLLEAVDDELVERVRQSKAK